MRYFLRKTDEPGVIQVQPLTKPALSDGRVLVRSVRFGLLKRVQASKIILDY